MSAPYQGLGPTLAECLTAEKIALTAELGQVKEERDEARELLAGWPDARVSKAEAERDTALRHVEALADPPMHLDDVDYPAAVEAARAFLLSMREKADQ